MAESGPAAAAVSRYTLHLARAHGVGRVVVNSSDRTLYVFSRDTHGKPTCTSAKCVSFWPPLTIAKSKKPTAGPGLNRKLLGTVRDRNGKLQVTYDHRPLYRFAGDKRPGQANGEGIRAFGGIWRAVNAKGRPVVATTTTTTTTTSTGGGSSTTTTTTAPYWA